MQFTIIQDIMENLNKFWFSKLPSFLLLQIQNFIKVPENQPWKIRLLPKLSQPSSCLMFVYIFHPKLQLPSRTISIWLLDFHFFILLSLYKIKPPFLSLSSPLISCWLFPHCGFLTCHTVSQHNINYEFDLLLFAFSRSLHCSVERHYAAFFQ